MSDGPPRITWYRDATFPRRTGPTWPLVIAAGISAVVMARSMSMRILPALALMAIVGVGLPAAATVVSAPVGNAVARWIARRRVAAHGGERWWRDREWALNGETASISRGLAWTRPRTDGVTGFGMVWAIGVLIASGLVCAAGGQLAGWGALAGGAAAYACLLRWRGRLVVSWRTFPQFTGGTVEFLVGTSPGGARIDDARIYLRCVRERPVRWPSWARRVEGVWSHPLGVPPDLHVGPDSYVPVTFDVPAHFPETDLHATEPVFWEVVVVGRIGKQPYADRAIAPVYAREVQ